MSDNGYRDGWDAATEHYRDNLAAVLHAAMVELGDYPTLDVRIAHDIFGAVFGAAEADVEFGERPISY